MTTPSRLRRVRDLRIPSFRDMDKVVLGLVSMVVTAAIVGGVFAVGGLKLLHPHYDVTAVFADSEGLKQGAPVRVAGIGVGRVASVTPDWQAGQMLMTLQINNGVTLGPNTRAEVGTTTFLGGDFIRLSNTEGKPAMQHLPPSQRRIPIERTRQAYTLINALSDASKEARAIDAATIDNVIHQLGSSLSDNIINIPDLVTNLQTLGTALTARQDQFNQLLMNGEQITATLKSRDQQLAQLIGQARGLLGALASRRDQLAAVLGSGSDAVQRLAALIDGKQAQIDSLLSSVHASLGVLGQRLPDINAGLADIGPLASGLASAIGNGYFNVEVTGMGQLSLANYNKILTALLGPGSCPTSPGGARCSG